MRLSSRTVFAEVSVVDSATRPVRINFSGIVFRLDVDEAIDLATQLVDTVETIKTPEERTAP